MWTISKITATDHNQKFRIEKDDSFITYRQFLKLLESSKPFRSFYNQLLAASPFEAFLWENKPVSQNSLDQLYECNLICSPFLADQEPDMQTFRPHFKSRKKVVSFPNLGRDAQLITPCPINDPVTYTHIGHFVRNAPSEQIDQLWQLTARQMNDKLGKAPKWLSTSGLGVFWLHVRIDTRPKYYQTQEYTVI